MTRSRPILTAVSLLLAAVVLIGLYQIANSSDASSFNLNLLPAQQSSGVPTGTILHFNDSVCPSGWSEYTAGQGRYIVGLTSSGTPSATIGTALSNNENRAVGQHSHDVDDPGHTHNLTDPGHTHTATDSGHTHTINDPGHSHTVSMRVNGSGDGDGDGSPKFSTSGSPTTSSNTTNISVNSAQADVYIDSNGAGITVSDDNQTNLTLATSGDIAGTNAPYLQLLLCQKD